MQVNEEMVLYFAVKYCLETPGTASVIVMTGVHYLQATSATIMKRTLLILKQNIIHGSMQNYGTCSTRDAILSATAVIFSISDTHKHEHIFD